MGGREPNASRVCVILQRNGRLRNRTSSPYLSPCVDPDFCREHVCLLLTMHLYLGENPRTLYLVTSSHEEDHGRPSRALVLRAAENNPSQAVVEFLHKDQVNLSHAVRLTSRIVKGCLGLICIAEGA